MRYIGVRGQAIVWVSDTKPVVPTTQTVLTLPPDLESISTETLMSGYYVRGGRILSRSEVIPPEEIRVAMIARYGINCGIATYTKYLCDQIRSRVKTVKIFSEGSTPLPSDDTDNVVRCWTSSEDYTGVLDAINAYEPDVVFVQHEYGCFSNASAWNVLIGHLSSKWRTVVVLHSVYEHPSKLIFEAPCQEVVVHSLSAKDLLVRRGIDHCKIHYIPHGCLETQTIDTKWSSVGSKHIIFQYGFGYEYKGWENAIEIVDRLRVKYPDVVYIGIFNISKYTEEFNNQYYQKLMSKVRDRKLEKHFVLHKGFRHENVLLSYLCQAQVAIFPYWNHPEWLVHGASGAVRMALASGTPTVVGDVPFFTEFKGHVPVCNTLDDYVATISKIFDNPAYRKEILDKTKKFIGDRSWDKVAEWYLECTPGKEFTAL